MTSFVFAFLSPIMKTKFSSASFFIDRLKIFLSQNRPFVRSTGTFFLPGYFPRLLPSLNLFGLRLRPSGLECVLTRPRRRFSHYVSVPSFSSNGFFFSRSRSLPPTNLRRHGGRCAVGVTLRLSFSMSAAFFFSHRFPVSFPLPFLQRPTFFCPTISGSSECSLLALSPSASRSICSPSFLGVRSSLYVGASFFFPSILIRPIGPPPFKRPLNPASARLFLFPEVDPECAAGILHSVAFFSRKRLSWAFPSFGLRKRPSLTRAPVSLFEAGFPRSRVLVRRRTTFFFSSPFLSLEEVYFPRPLFRAIDE